MLSLADIRICILLVFLTSKSYCKSVSLQVSKDPCSYVSRNYSLSWKYDEQSQDVVFKLSSISTFKNFWTGVYFGDKTPTDAIGVIVRSGQFGLLDGHLVNGTFSEDNVTNVQILTFDWHNGHLTAEFGRPIETDDKEDTNLSHCTTFFLPTQPEPIEIGAEIRVSESYETLKVCDLVATCVDKDISRAGIIKRQEDQQSVAQSAEPAGTAVALTNEVPQCDYTKGTTKNKVSWTVHDNKITFNVNQNAKKGKWWSAIGVGNEMLDLDMIVFFTENGELTHQSAYRTSGYGIPEEANEMITGLENTKKQVKSNRVQLTFDIDKTFFDRRAVNGCVTLQFGILAGEYIGLFNIRKHEETPERQNVCNYDKCTDGTDTSSGNEDNVEGSGSDVPEGFLSSTSTSLSPDQGPLKSPVNPQDLGLNHPDENTVEEGSGENIEPVVTSATQQQNEQTPSSQGAGSMTFSSLRTSNENQQSSSSSIGANPAGNPTTSSGQHANGNPSTVTPQMEGNPPVGVVSSSTPVPGAIQSVTPMASSGTASSMTMSSGNNHQNLAITGSTPGSGALNSSSSGMPVQNPLISASTTANPNNPSISSSSSISGQNIVSNVTPVPGSNNVTATSTVSSVSSKGNVSQSTVRPVQVNPDVTANTTGCEEGHVDLKVCENYFKDYLGKVQDWATKHEMSVGPHMWKACTLLSEVKHVPTACCTIFRQTCATYLKLK